MIENSCLEIRQEDIVRIDLYLPSECIISVPPSVVLQSLTKNAVLLGTPALSLALSLAADSLEVQMTDAPSLKVSNARQQAGNIYTHDLQIPLQTERRNAESAVDALHGKDFNAVLTRADGSRDVVYALPNASAIDIDESQSTTSNITLKVKMLSMSHTIRLTT